LKAVLIVASLTYCGGTVPADKAQRPGSGPSIEETRAWIAGRLPELSQHMVEMKKPKGIITHVVLAASLDSMCLLRIESQLIDQVIIGSKLEIDTTRYIWRVPLREVDRNGVRVQETTSFELDEKLDALRLVVVQLLRC
jgi:hypothetical protein